MRTPAMMAMTLALFAAVPCYAVDPAEAPQSDREVGGHVFQPSRFVVSPFGVTAFGGTTLFGAGTATGPRIDLGNGTVLGERDYDLAAFGEGFDFSGRITPALSLRANLFWGAYSGINARSITVAGVTAQGSFDLGLTLGQRLMRTLRGAVTFDVAASPEYDVLIARGIVKAIQEYQQNQNVEAPDVLEKGARVRYMPGASVAWALHPAVGLTANAQFIWARLASGSGKTDQFGGAFGGALDLDLDALMNAPIGLMGVYRWEGLGDLVKMQDVGGGIFYTRRLHLALGMELTRHSVTLRPQLHDSQLKTVAALANIVLRYYW